MSAIHDGGEDFIRDGNIEYGRQKERAAIVRWICVANYEWCPVPVLERIAKGIEAGEHVREKP